MSIRTYDVCIFPENRREVDRLINRMSDSGYDHAEEHVLYEAFKHRGDLFFIIEIKNENSVDNVVFKCDWFVFTEVIDGKSELQAARISVPVLSE